MPIEVRVPDWRGSHPPVNEPTGTQPPPSADFAAADAAWEVARAAAEQAEAALRAAQGKIQVYRETVGGVRYFSRRGSPGFYGTSESDRFGQDLVQHVELAEIAFSRAREQAELAWHDRHKLWLLDARRAAAAHAAKVIDENDAAFRAYTEAKKARQRQAQAEKERARKELMSEQKRSR